MKNRSRDYYRKMRARAIRRKRRILRQYGWTEELYPHIGMYSKNKIHCSCPICKSKAYYGKHMETRQEELARLKYEEEQRDYFSFGFPF